MDVLLEEWSPVCSIQAVVELLQEMELEKEVICGKVQEKFHISSQEAAQEVEKYWK